MSGKKVLEWEEQGGGKMQIWAYPESPGALVVLYGVSVTGKYRVLETWVGRQFPEHMRGD